MLRGLQKFLHSANRSPETGNRNCGKKFQVPFKLGMEEWALKDTESQISWSD